MKYSKLTPGKNLIWESSRMMLPEHKAYLVDRREQLKERERPILDPQRLEELSGIMAYAFNERIEVCITVFSPYQNKLQRGVIQRLDPQLGRIKLLTEDHENWIKIENILEIDLD